MHYWLVTWLTAERAVPLKHTIRMEATVQILEASVKVKEVPTKLVAEQSEVVLLDEHPPSIEEEVALSIMIAPEPLVVPKPAPTKPVRETKPQKPAPSKTDKQARLSELQRAFLKEDVQTRAAGLPSPIGVKDTAVHDASEMANYLSMIAGKIRKNVNRHLCRNAQPETIFVIQLKPNGMLQGKPKLVQSSGVASCNDAIERAILQSLPLPVPSNVESFNVMRELHLRFRPQEEFFD